MRDLDLWQALGAAAIERKHASADELAPLIEEAAREPLPKRAMFAAAIASATMHRSPRVRAAAVRALTDVLGYEGQRAIAASLDDNNADVRAAAVDSLATTVSHDGAPFLCALFHRRIDVRRRALAKLRAPKEAPPRVSLSHAILLRADKAHVADVDDVLDGRSEDGSIAPALLAARKRKIMGDDEVVRRLAKLPFADRCAEVLAAMPFPATIDAQVATPDALHKYLTSLVHTDPFSDVLAILWRHPALAADAKLSDGAPIVSALIDARRHNRGVREVEHRRIAVSITQVMLTTGEGSPRMLAFASLSVPTLLLLHAHEAVARDRSRAALRALPDVAGELVGRATTLKAYFDAGLLREDATGDAGRPPMLDVATIAGAMRLVFDAPYQRLREVIPTDDVANAFWLAPLASMSLLSLAPRSPADREAFRALVRSVMTAMKKNAPDVVAALCGVLPSEAGFALEDLEKSRPGIVEPALLALLDRSDGQLDDASARKLERNAAILAAQLGATSMPNVLGAALMHESASPVRDIVLDAVLRAAPKSQLKTAVTALEARDDDAIGALVTRLSTSVLPVENERFWAIVLAKSKHAGAQAWAAPRTSAGDTPRAIAPALAERITTCAAAELPLVASVFLREPLTGIVDGLAARTGPSVVSARLAASILASHDPPHLAAEAFERAISEAPPFLAAIDHALLDVDARRDLPLLATAWVHHDAAHAVRFEHHCRIVPGGLKSVVELALALPSPLVTWKMMRALVEVVRSWAYQRKALLEKLDDPLAVVVASIIAGQTQPRAPTTPAGTFAGARAVKRLAAELVAIAHSSGKAASFVAAVRTKLATTPLALDADVRAILELALPETLAAASSAPPKAAATVSAHVSIEVAAAKLTSTDVDVVRAAVDELLAAGGDGRSAIVSALASTEPPPAARAIVERAIFDDDDVARLLADADPEVRFHVAMRIGDAKAALAAACAMPDGSATIRMREWLTADDVTALIAGWSKSTRALWPKLVRSPHAPAYTKAAWSLLSLLHDETDLRGRARSADASEPLAGAEAAAGLRAFLAAGDDREPALRAEVAAALLRASGVTAFEELAAWLAPLLVSCALAPPEPRHETLLRDAVPRSAWREVIAGAAVAGDHVLDGALETQMDRRHLDDDLCAAIALHLLKRGVDSEDAQPLFAVLRRARYYDDPRVDDLRDAVQWGIRQARFLLGRPVGVEMIHDALGYTRLHQPRIFINPMPLLRGERGGDDVVRGLMVHEIGHHRYHADELGKKCWADAQKEGIAGLLNLVADEHLERNLRAESDEYGDHLKVLASYAFQHAARDVWVEHLLAYLGAHAASVLTKVKIEPGRKWATVRVELGKLLAEISAHTGFARFMRALRQGLGGRSGDGDVEKALALFDRKTFRASKMDRLLDIAREIKRIFGDETKILETFGLHETMEAEESDLSEEGFSPDELQRELNKRQSNKTDKTEKPRFNDSPDERFDPIDQIVPLAHEPSAHRVVAEQGKRATRALRSVFDELGTKIVVEHRRMSGRSLDRQGLGNAVVKLDPRLLVRRTPTPAADLFVGIVVDCSGSMAGQGSMDKARVFATSLAEAARGHKGVDIRVFGFTDQIIYDAGDANHCAAHALNAGGGNNDSAGLWHAAVVAKRSRRKRKLLVMVSDGLPTECSASSLRALASRLERTGTLTAQVAVRPLSERCFKHYIEILDDDVDGAARRFARVVSKLVRKTVGAR
jgi:Mg-chelatase subunit ChlD